MNWELIPEHMREGVKLYIEQGVRPGSFLAAVVCNDLKEAIGNADSINRERLADIVTFFYTYAPAACWGSPKAMKDWMKAKAKGGVA